MSVSADMKCPKCIAPMRAIERNGIVVERCAECGGIFLDRGELERLMRAEGEYNDREARGAREQVSPLHREQSPAPYRDHDDDDDDYRYRDPQYHQGRPMKKKRKNFLEDIFDFG